MHRMRAVVAVNAIMLLSHCTRSSTVEQVPNCSVLVKLSPVWQDWWWLRVPVFQGAIRTEQQTQMGSSALHNQLRCGPSRR